MLQAASLLAARGGEKRPRRHQMESFCHIFGALSGIRAPSGGALAPSWADRARVGGSERAIDISRYSSPRASSRYINVLQLYNTAVHVVYRYRIIDRVRYDVVQLLISCTKFSTRVQYSCRSICTKFSRFSMLLTHVLCVYSSTTGEGR